jgi:hypothetical protein
MSSMRKKEKPPYIHPEIGKAPKHPSTTTNTNTNSGGWLAGWLAGCGHVDLQPEVQVSRRRKKRKRAKTRKDEKKERKK